jgi:hypothetical protein
LVPALLRVFRAVWASGSHLTPVRLVLGLLQNALDARQTLHVTRDHRPVDFQHGQFLRAILGLIGFADRLRVNLSPFSLRSVAYRRFPTTRLGFADSASSGLRKFARCWSQQRLEITMNAPHLPAVRYRIMKPLDLALAGSSRQNIAPIAHRATLTLGPNMAAHNFAHRVVNKDSVASRGDSILTEAGLRGPAAAVNHRDELLRCATGTIVGAVPSA